MNNFKGYMMTGKFLILLIICSPFLAFAQSENKAGATQKPTIWSECDKVFTRVEQIPSLKISNQQFEDSLTDYLKANDAFHKNQKATLRFVVTDKNGIFEIEEVLGRINDLDIVTAGILKLSDLWVPAIQNGRNVCAYVRLELDFKKGILHVAISQ